MDDVNVMTNSINMMGLDNADHRQIHSSGCEDSTLHDIGDMASRIVDHLEEKVIADFAADEANDETISFAERKADASKEACEKAPNKEDNSKIVKVRGKAKRTSSVPRKSTNFKPTAATLLTKHLDGNEESLTSISYDLTSPTKQPLSHATDCRLSDDGQAVEGYASPDADRSQMSAKVGEATTNIGVSLPEVSRDQRKNLKSLKQNASDKAEDPQSTSNSKTRRSGTTPAYSFSFKCNERAEKRKEFYSKLEEKVHAKEVEKSNFQAKTKETQEAEMKLLRKSLTFKATPMPSFYQEPAPPKVELKKLPPTRAKSPKFGRQKSASQLEKATDTEGNQSRVSRSTDLSLRCRVSPNGIAKDSAIHSKRPQRKSLPRLPSQKSTILDPEEIPSPVQQPRDVKSDLEGTPPIPNKVELVELTEPADTESEEKLDTETEEKPIEQKTEDEPTEFSDKEEIPAE